MDIKLDIDNKIPLSASYDLQLVSGLDAIAQDVRVSLHTVLGEWFLDSTAGFDLIRATGKGAERILDAEVKRVTLKRPGVFLIKNYTRTKDSSGLANVNASVVCSDGEFPINF